jgi:peptidyl-prolyl cis-trans isomerase B (cyclophilin B)
MRRTLTLCLGLLLLAACGTTKNSKSSKKSIKTPMVAIDTDFGTIKIKLYDETPLHRDNFLKLVKEGYYDDLLFHRIIPNFMVQGGDPNSRGATASAQLGIGGPGYTIPAEFNDSLVHTKGALAAARQGDQVNPKKASSGSQFYIVQGEAQADAMLNRVEQMKGFKYTEAQREAYKTMGGTPHLDRDYTVFGQVVEGFEVLDKIAAVKRGYGDRPVEDVKMKVRIIEVQ